MKRSPMKRGGPLQRRTPLRTKPKALPARERAPLVLPSVRPLRLGVMALADTMAAPVEKEGAIQHEKYMAAVRKLPCAHCGVTGFTQFCHADEGKGMGIKTDCRRGWPGCGPHNGMPGCHYLLGSTGKLGREERRRLEAEYGRRTRTEIMRQGLWPAGLPLWVEEPANADQFQLAGNNR